MRRSITSMCVLFALGQLATAVEPAQEQAPFAFGIVADVQYADKEKAGARHYRESLARLEECVDELNQRDLAFTIQLGDLIDGNATPQETLSDLDRVLAVFNEFSMPTYHVIGNHCLTADKEALRDKLDLDRFYYAFTAPSAPGWRFVVLDGNDAGYGVLGATQLDWLRSTLAEARSGKESVVLFNHFALLPGAAQHHRMAAPEPVLELIRGAGCVVAYFAGHDHAGGYTFHDGVHHVTLKGMVEAPVRNAFAVIEVHPTTINVLGRGKEASRMLEMEGTRPSAPSGR